MKKECVYRAICGVIAVLPVVIVGNVNMYISSWMEAQGINNYLHENMQKAQIFITTLLLLEHIILLYMLSQSKLYKYSISEKEKSMGIGTHVIAILTIIFYVLVYWSILK